MPLSKNYQTKHKVMAENARIENLRYAEKMIAELDRLFAAKSIGEGYYSAQIKKYKADRAAYGGQ